MQEPDPARAPGAERHDERDPTEVVSEALHALGDPRGAYSRVFGSAAFFRLWLAQVLTALGDWLGFLAVVVLAQRIGADAPGAAIGLVMAARLVPGLFLATAAGVLIDRMDRKQVMVAANSLRAGVVCTLPFVDSLLGLVFASLVLEAASLLFVAAKEAAVPGLVRPDRLTSANSLSLAAGYGTFPLASVLFAGLAALAGWLGGVWLFSDLGVSQESLAFFVNAVLHLAAALMIARLSVPRDHIRTSAPDQRQIDLGAVFSEIKEGWHFIFLNPLTRTVVLGLAAGLIGGGMLVPLGPVFLSAVLGAGPAGFGMFTFALGSGVAAGVVSLSLMHHRVHKVRVFGACVVATGVALLAAASMSTLVPAALLVAVMGTAAGSVYVLGFTLLHENTGDEIRGRVFAGLFTLVRFCLLASFAVGPPLSDVLDRLSAVFFDRSLDLAGVTIAIPGVRLTLWLAGGIILVAGVIAARSLRVARDAASAAAGDQPAA